jgi:glycine cleavage system H lipoate-binding protein
MRCPFLLETEVQFCGDSFFGKLIPRAALPVSDQKCSSPDFLQCPNAKRRTVETENQPYCPCLQSALVQYCAAAPVRKFVPYTDSLTCRCMSETFRFCPLYLNVSRPEEGVCADIAVPPDLFYSANHLWLEMDENGLCHIGIDAFLARILGRVERIQFVESKGTVRPSAVVTARGVDLHLGFPNRLLLMAVNSYLRARPERVASDPYRQGWLFEGTNPSSRKEGGALQVKAGLRTGSAAVSWMKQEIESLALALGERGQPQRAAAAAESFDPGALDALPREELLQIALRFCGSNRTFRR